MGKTNLAVDRLGEIRKNKNESLMEIVEYNNANDILVKFDQGNIVHTNYWVFFKGNVKNVYDKTVCGKGFLGEGKYKVFENNDNTQYYKTWREMLRRCYNEEIHKKNPAYSGCTVIEEWHNFQNFAAWYNANYYEIEGQRMCLDKDILIKNNKVYSPNTCVFVPQRINKLFTKSEATRGNFPIGVNFHKGRNNYVAQCSGIKKHIGSYSTPEEAFNAYKKYKEKQFIDIANEYKDIIPEKLYNALMLYKVEIND